VEHVEVGSFGNHVRAAAEDAAHDAEVAEDGHQDDPRHDPHLRVQVQGLFKKFMMNISGKHTNSQK